MQGHGTPLFTRHLMQMSNASLLLTTLRDQCAKRPNCAGSAQIAGFSAIPMATPAMSLTWAEPSCELCLARTELASVSIAWRGSPMKALIVRSMVAGAGAFAAVAMACPDTGQAQQSITIS